MFIVLLCYLGGKKGEDENLVQINHDPLITDNLTEKMYGGDDLSIRLEQNGRLIR